MLCARSLFSRPSHHCSCLKPKSSPKCRRPQRIIFFAHSGVRIRSAGHTERPAAMLFGLPLRQRLPKSLRELHIPSAAARTRKVSGAPFRPNPRKLWRQFKWILFLTDSGVRVLPHQPRSAVSAVCDPCLEEPPTFQRVRPVPTGLCRGGRGIQVSQGRVLHTSLWSAIFDIRCIMPETGSRATRDRFVSDESTFERVCARAGDLAASAACVHPCRTAQPSLGAD